ncbi:MAG: hypothetical protein DRN30_00570 [Thermoplasmata archaeon]|nr:MAG: hypothetical protein DRN30_00570 [Thermoplasmata archaeon]
MVVYKRHENNSRKYRRFIVAVVHYGDVVYNVSKWLGIDVLIPVMIPTENTTYFMMSMPRIYGKRSYKSTLREICEIVESHKDLEFYEVVSYQKEKFLYIARKSYGTLKSFIKEGVIVLEPLYVVRGVKYFNVLAKSEKSLFKAKENIEKVSPTPTKVRILRGGHTGGKEYQNCSAEVLDILSSLTLSEKEALFTAYNMGYFEWPRKANSEIISRVLGVSKATFIEHLRKAEKKILDKLLGSCLERNQTC